MAETELQILSDLHLESPQAYAIFHIEAKAPYLALVGDIGYVKDKDFFNFLRRQLNAFRVVFLVVGNHEPYHSNWFETKLKIKRFIMDSAPKSGEPLGQLGFLDKARYDISSTVSVLGCTLFSQVAHDQKENVGFGINDFYHVDDWSLDAHQAAHRADLDWLNHEIDVISRLEPDRKVVVLTHYFPLNNKEVVDPQNADSKISSGFMTDLSGETCRKSGVVKLWAFGHTHTSIATLVNRIMLQDLFRTRGGTTFARRQALTARKHIVSRKLRDDSFY